MENLKVDWFYVGKDIQIQSDENFEFVGDLFDELDDLITVNEINTGTHNHWLCADNNIFEFDPRDLEQLNEKGFCRVYYIGSLADHIDLENENDITFMEWHLSTEDIKIIEKL